MIGQIAKINDQVAVISGPAARHQTLKTLNSSATVGSFASQRRDGVSGVYNRLRQGGTSNHLSRAITEAVTPKPINSMF